MKTLVSPSHGWCTAAPSMDACRFRGFAGSRYSSKYVSQALSQCSEPTKRKGAGSLRRSGDCPEATCEGSSREGAHEIGFCERMRAGRFEDVACACVRGHLELRHLERKESEVW